MNASAVATRVDHLHTHHVTFKRFTSYKRSVSSMPALDELALDVLSEILLLVRLLLLLKCYHERFSDP